MSDRTCRCGCGSSVRGEWARGHNPKVLAREPAARFWEKVDLSGACWLWTAAKDRYGYGRFNTCGDSGTVLAHCFAYELLVGPVPAGTELDHLCRNHACVRPEHMEPVSHRTNVLRGESPPAMNARKQVCDAGHEFDARGEDWRQCRTCARERARLNSGRSTT